MLKILRNCFILISVFMCIACLKELDHPQLDKDTINNIFDPTYTNYDKWLKQVEVDSIPNPNFSLHVLLRFKFEITNDQLKNHFGEYYILYAREGKTGPSVATVFRENNKHYCYLEMNNFNSSTGDYCFTTYIVNNNFDGWKSGKLDLCWAF